MSTRALTLCGNFSKFLYVTCLVVVLPNLLLPQSQIGDFGRFLGVYLLFGSFLLAIPSALKNLLGSPEVAPRPHVAAGRRVQVAGIWGGYLRWCFLLLLPGPLLAQGDDVTVLALGLLLVVASGILRFVYPLVTPTDNWHRAMLAGQMAAVVRMDASIPDALDRLQFESIRDFGRKLHRFPVVLSHLVFDLRQGSLLSGAISEQEYFPPVWLSLIRFGEQTDRLAPVLEQLSLIERNRPQRLQLLRPLLLIPIILFIGWNATGQMGPFMEGTGNASLYAFSSQAISLLVVALALAGLLVTLPILRFPTRLQKLSFRIQRLPLLWPLIQVEQQQLAIYALAAGANLDKSGAELLLLARESVSHPDFERALDPELARRGGTLSQVLALAPDLFSVEVRALVEYGESHGQLSEALQESQSILADLLVDRQLRHESQVLMFFHFLTGALVLCLAATIFLPLVNMALEAMSEAYTP